MADRVSESRPEVALFQISVETGARRQVTFPPAGASDWMPAVSPDGRTLGYARVVENGRGDVWAVPLAGGRAQRLTDTNEVFFCWTWAADGKDLLISYRRSGRAYLWRQPHQWRPGDASSRPGRPGEGAIGGSKRKSHGIRVQHRG